jgi:hypothetical protein
MIERTLEEELYFISCENYMKLNVSIYKVLLKTLPFSYGNENIVHGYFYFTIAKLNSCERHHMACKAQNICY